MEDIALKMLSREDIDINIQNEYGKTVLYYAYTNKMNNVLLTILERFGTDENTRKYALEYKQTLSEECLICLSNKICDTLLIHEKTMSCHTICKTCYDMLPNNKCHICRENIDYVI